MEKKRVFVKIWSYSLYTVMPKPKKYRRSREIPEKALILSELSLHSQTTFSFVRNYVIIIYVIWRHCHYFSCSFILVVHIHPQICTLILGFLNQMNLVFSYSLVLFSCDFLYCFLILVFLYLDCVWNFLSFWVYKLWWGIE